MQATNTSAIMMRLFNRTVMEKIEIEQKIVEMIKTVYDPEIPVNIYDLGLVYRIEVGDDFTVDIDMTLTAPTCPAERPAG